MHYALPLALQRAGILEHVFAEWFEAPGSVEQRLVWLLRKVRPSLARRAEGRTCAELDPRKVISNPWLTIWQQISPGRFRSPEAFFDFVSHGLGQWVLKTGLGKANALFGFVRHISPALCGVCRDRGLLTVGDQIIAPAAVEGQEAQVQTQAWPGWESTPPPDDLSRVTDRERHTWRALAHLTCPSPYVREGLIKQGVNPGKITLLPYPIDCKPFRTPERGNSKKPLVVGFVGAVNLRKGAPYFFEVARRFDPRQVRFVMVGPVALDPAKLAAHKGPIELVGIVPRSEVSAWLEKFDVFFFPTTCEGSAGAVMEAMASGLPVVTTENSGTVARHGVEGFVSPYQDLGGFTEAIARLAADPDLRLTMGRAARRRAEEFDLESYSRALGRLFSQLLQAGAL